jgi:hypothetical protein
MAHHLSDAEIDQVVSLLVGWKGKLTWEGLVAVHKKRNGKVRSRQAFARAAAIKIAFDTAKKRLRHAEAADDRPATPDELRMLRDRVARLTAENEQLRAENVALLDQFVTWQYNAFAAGITYTKLNEPKPSIDMKPTERPSGRR